MITRGSNARSFLLVSFIQRDTNTSFLGKKDAWKIVSALKGSSSLRDFDSDAKSKTHIRRFLNIQKPKMEQKQVTILFLIC